MKQIVLSTVTMVALASGAQSHAQEGEAAAPPAANPPASDSKTSSPKSKKAEVMQVTGSRIKRVDVEGPTQVQTVTKEDMEARGQTTVSDVIRDIPVSTAGATREESNRGAPGFSGVDLRGIGAKYTLVLIDGKRIPSDPSFDAVDVGAIPTAMIEKVEILKEGAGAIYGSDAVGGVVNIITKKAFDGTSVLYSRAQPEGKGGAEDRFEVVTGKTFDSGSLVLSGSYRNRDSIASKDRKFIGQGWSRSGAPGSFIAIAPDGTDQSGAVKYKQNDGGYVADPNCALSPTSRVMDSGEEGKFCQYNYEAVRTISPQITDYSLMAKVDYKVNEKVGLYALLKTLKRNAKDEVAPAPSDGPIQITDAAAVQNIKNVLGAAGSSIDPANGGGLRLLYRTVPLGNRVTLTEDVSNLAVVGLNGQLSDTWDWDFSYTFGKISREEKGDQGFWLKDRLPQIIASGRFNPFDPNDKGAALREAAYQTLEKQATETRQASAIFSGPVADLAGGPVQVAVGASVLNERFSSNADPELLSGNVQGSSGSQGGGKRQVSALFAEASLPVVKNSELNIAARFDHYEKYGESFNPRVAFKYRLDDVLLRTSVGTGFRAPTLQEESTNGGASYPSFIDATKCKAAKDAGDSASADSNCREQQYEYTQTASNDVKPEKVFIYSLGAVYAPTLTSNISLDFWAVKIKDSIGIPDLHQLTELEANGNLSYQAKGIVITRDEDQRLENVTSPATNLASKELAGLDLAASLVLGSRASATFEYDLDTSYQIYNKVAAFEGSPLVDQAGKVRSPRYRANNTFGTTLLNDHHLALIVRTIGGTEKANPEYGKIPVFNSYDLNYSYLKFFDGTASLGVINFANLRPPTDESANPTINYDLYSYAGRSYYARLTQNF